MALAFGAISSVSTSQTPTSVTLSGLDTLGIVFVVGDTTGDNITAATWNSVSMTKIAAVQSPGDRWMSAWYIDAPASATTISFTGGSFWRSFSFYYTGAGDTQVDAFNTNTATNSATISTTPTVLATNCWTIMCQKDNTGNVTYSTDVGTMRANADAGGIAISDSNGIVSQGAQTTTHTADAGTPTHGAIGFSIRATDSVVSLIKTINGLAKASAKTVNGLAIASVKTWNGLT